MLIKVGDLVGFKSLDDQLENSSVQSISKLDDAGKLLAKMAHNAKKLIPKPDDFTICSCIMMHAAEASLVNQETGDPILNKLGEPVKGAFVAIKDSQGRESVRWESPDNILPYKNNNADIFPEEDLVKAHKEWVGKPLCRDHMSNSVDGIRGIIIDTYYDPKFKRVFALFALDRKNYGELARKVEAGYATSVSMGTAVGRSICSECGNVATVESEYCHHVKSKTCHGEVNKDLSPIELSIVVTGADPKAKIMTVLAQLEDYQNQVNQVASGDADQSVLKDIMANLDSMQVGLQANGQTDAVEDRLVNEVVQAISILNKSSDHTTKDQAIQTINTLLSRAGKSLYDLSQEGRTRILTAAASRGLEMGDDVVAKTLQDFLTEQTGKGEPGMGIQPGMVSREGNPTNELVDSNGYTLDPTPDLGLGDVFPSPGGLGLSASQEEKSENKQGANLNLANKIASMKEQIQSLERQLNRENVMTFADLKKKRQERKAYWQGTEEPTPGKPQYELMGDQDGIREKDDKQMNQTGDLGGPNGLVPGDEQTKKLMQRAELEARQAKRAQWLKEAAGAVVELKDGTKALVDEQTGQRMADDGKTASKKDKDEDDKDSKEEDKKEEKSEDKDKEDKKEPPFAKKDKKDDKEDKDKDENGDMKNGDDKKDKGEKKEAYWQGTEDPTPGKPQYDKLSPPDQDVIREKDDKHMNQTGDLGGSDGLVPGDEQTKKEMQRMASLGGKLLTHASGDKSKSKWVFTTGDKSLFSISAQEAYGDFLNDKFTAESTFADLFHSKDWGNNVRKMVKDLGLEKAAEKLGIKLAQEPAPAPAPAAAPAEAPVEPEPELPEIPEEPEADEEKDLKDRLAPLIEAAEAALEDLKVEVEGPEEGVAGLDVEKAPEPEIGLEEPAAVPTGEPGLGELAGAGGERLASVSEKDMLTAYAFLSDTANELCYIEAKYDERKGDHKFRAVAEQAIHDAEIAVEDTNKLVRVYADQRKANRLEARAKAREQLVREAMGTGYHAKDMDYHEDYQAKDKDYSDYSAKDKDYKDYSDKDYHEGYEAKDKDYQDYKDYSAKDKDYQDDYSAKDYAVDYTLDSEEKEEVEEIARDLDVEHHAGEADYDDEMDYASYDQMSAEARKAWRESLVKQAKGYDDVYEGERGSGGHTVEGLDVSVKDQLDKVEVLHETHQAMEDIATKPLGKVREAAVKLNEWIKVAGIDVEAVDRLVAVGAVDAEVAKYWKEYWGGQGGEKEYAEGLLKDYDSQKKSASSQADQVRIRRAYALGIEAQKKGIVDHGQAALDQYVDTLVSLSEEHFNGLKNHVSMYKAPQQLVSAPLVGLNHQEEAPVEKTASSADPHADLMRLFD